MATACRAAAAALRPSLCCRGPAAGRRGAAPAARGLAAAAAGGPSARRPASAAAPTPHAAAGPPGGRGRPQPPAQQPPGPLVIVSPPSLPPVEGWGNAVLLVDKPQGWTSFDVCGRLRFALSKLLGRKPLDIKVGHAGTLDPMATGLLVVCVGQATKQVDTYQAQSKAYEGVMRLGQRTPSHDADTPVEREAPWEHVTDAELMAAVAGQTGALLQVPPIYSAIKVDGQRLYEIARAGDAAAAAAVRRDPRPVTVTRFDVSRVSAGGAEVSFVVECTKGTYVRSLVRDVGEALGCGAVMTALRRTAVGELRVAGAWPAQALNDAVWAAVEAVDPNAAAAERQRRTGGERGDRPVPGTGERGSERGSSAGGGRRLRARADGTAARPQGLPPPAAAAHA